MPAPQTNQPKTAPAKSRNLAALILPLGIGVVLIASFFGLRSGSDADKYKVVIGAADAVYYSQGATERDAKAVGQALKAAGYFTDQGADVTVSGSPNGAVIAFATKPGVWTDRNRLLAFEEIGRRIGLSATGFPVHIRLLDAAGKVRKDITAGKRTFNGKDVIFYLGAATEADAVALAQTLQYGQLFTGQGAIVLLSKEDVKTISFMVNENAWTRPENLAGFKKLAREAAVVLGGLPITFRLVDFGMQVHTEEVLQ